MKSEELSYKIRQLSDASNETDLDWDSGKFWGLYMARKRRRRRLVVLSYSMTAVLSFAVGYIFFTAHSFNQYVDTNSSVSSIHQIKQTTPLLKNEASPVAVANLKLPKPLAQRARVLERKPSKSLQNGSYVTRRFSKQSIPVLYKENNELPSLIQMFEQAQKERELRNLSVQLEEQANYNSFWLTVNQHLLANKLNSDQLHYARY